MNRMLGFIHVLSKILAIFLLAWPQLVHVSPGKVGVNKESRVEARPPPNKCRRRGTVPWLGKQEHRRGVSKAIAHERAVNTNAKTSAFWANSEVQSKGSKPLCRAYVLETMNLWCSRRSKRNRGGANRPCSFLIEAKNLRRARGVIHVPDKPGMRCRR